MTTPLDLTREEAERIAEQVYANYDMRDAFRTIHPDTRRCAIDLVLAGAKARTADADALLLAKREGYASAHQQFAGIGKEMAEQAARLRYPLPAPPGAGSPSTPPVLTWHDAGYRTRDLADETGRIVGGFRKQDAYFAGQHLGKYIDYGHAERAVMASALKAYAAAQEGK